MGDKDPKSLETEFSEKLKHLTKKLAYPFEVFESIDDYQKPVNNLQKEDLFSNLKNKCSDDEEIEKRKEIINLFNIKNAEELTQLYSKSDALLHVFLRNV